MLRRFLVGWGWLPQEGLPPGTLPLCREPGHRQVERAARELTPQELERFLEERFPFPGTFREGGLQRGTCVITGRDRPHLRAMWVLSGKMSLAGADLMRGWGVGKRAEQSQTIRLKREIFLWLKKVDYQPFHTVQLNTCPWMLV